MVKDAVAGFVAGFVGTCLGFPLDTIKTRLQTSPNSESMLEMTRIIYKEEGIRTFYRGIESPLVALTILNTLNFSSYSTFKKILEVDNSLNNNTFDYRIPIAGALVGPLASIISTPFELVKTQMQVNKKKMEFSSSSFTTAIHIYKEYGLKGLYKAHAVNTTREIVFLSVYFTIYEHSKLLFTNIFPTSLAIPLSGGVSGSIGWFISFPLDCIKGNIQGSNLSQNESKSALNVGYDLFKSKGISGLYSGVLPSIMRAFIVSSTRFSAYEFVLYLIGDHLN